jgi:arabinose-5-phosphate isomerase
MKDHPKSVSQQMAAVMNLEATQLATAAARIADDGRCESALRLMLQCQGRILLTGMGKMGFVARKTAATLCSTGAPAIYLHPAEAIHGDLGIVTSDDVLIAMSNSGQTVEVLQIVEFMQRHNVPVIALTGNTKSALAIHSNVVIDCHVDREADGDSLTPTCSTTVTLATGDALAVALMTARGLTPEQFAIFHPGGSLGRKLLLKVDDLMHVGDDLPLADQQIRFGDALQKISEKKMGCLLVTDHDFRLAGIVTDGDLRRYLVSASGSISNMMDGGVEAVLTRRPATIGSGKLAAEAMRLMEDRQITTLPVLNDDHKIEGVLHLHDLIKAGLA